MEWACEDGGCLNVLPRSPVGTELYREEFSYALLWSLDITLQYNYLTCDGYRNMFMVSMRDIEITGGL